MSSMRLDYTIDFKLTAIFNAITTNDEDKLLRTIKTVPLDIINEHTQYIIKKLLDTQNVNMLHIFIIYGMDCNNFISVIGAECYPAYIDYIVNKEYEDYYENPIFCIINNYLRAYNEDLCDWYVNPIYYSMIHNRTYILLDFIRYGIIPLETYFIQSFESGMQQFLKYKIVSDHCVINTSDNLENDLLSDCIGLCHKSMEDFNAEDLECFEIFDKRMGDVNMFINKELSMHYNYIYKKKIDISVVYPRKYNELLKTIKMILSRYNDSNHKYYLPEELWTHIIIPMFVTNY